MAKIRHFSSFIGGSTYTTAAARTAVEAFPAHGNSNSSSMVQRNTAASEGPFQHSALGAGAGPQNAANSSGHMSPDSTRDRAAAGRASQDGKGGQASAGVLGSQGAGATTQPAGNSTRGRSTLQVFLGTSSSFVDR